MSEEDIPSSIEVIGEDCLEYDGFYKDEQYLWEKRDGIIYKFSVDELDKTGELYDVFCGECYSDLFHDDTADEWYCPRCES